MSGIWCRSGEAARILGVSTSELRNLDHLLMPELTIRPGHQVYVYNTLRVEAIAEILRETRPTTSVAPIKRSRRNTQHFDWQKIQQQMPDGFGDELLAKCRTILIKAATDYFQKDEVVFSELDNRCLASTILVWLGIDPDSPASPPERMEPISSRHESYMLGRAHGHLIRKIERDFQ